MSVQTAVGGISLLPNQKQWLSSEWNLKNLFIYLWLIFIQCLYLNIYLLRCCVCELVILSTNSTNANCQDLYSGKNVLNGVLFFKYFHFFSCGIDLGDNFVKRSTIDVDSIQKHAAKEAREAAERRHVKELKASLLRQQKQMEDDKLRCLKNQKLVEIWIFICYF